MVSSSSISQIRETDLESDQNPIENPSRISSREQAKRQRRDQILEAAIGCFATKGFHQTSIRDIAKSAGISLGNLYNHFSSKAELITEIATIEATEVARYQPIPTVTEDPDRMICDFIDDQLQSIEGQAHVILTLEIARESIWNDQIAEGFHQNHQVLISYLAAILEAGRDRGHYHPDLVPEETAHLILDAVEAVGLRFHSKNQDVPESARRPLVLNLLRMLR